MDTDSDGYIEEDEFLQIMEKYSKRENEIVCDELFAICDLKKDGKIDKEEFSIIVRTI